MDKEKIAKLIIAFLNFLIEIIGISTEKAISMTASKFGVSESFVKKIYNKD